MRDTLTEIAGVALVVLAFILFIVGSSYVGWWLAVLVAGGEALAAGVVLVVTANRRP